MTHIEGPLTPATPSHGEFDLLFPAPVKHCPDCGNRLIVKTALFYGGFHSGVTWTLFCEDSETYYEWADYVCDDADYCGNHGEAL